MMTLLNLIEKTIDYFFAVIPRGKPATTIAEKACLIAHRGAHDQRLRIIENTYAAFERALALGCWGIEFDVQTTADGVLVVNHDPTLDRLWGKKATIKQLSFHKLRKIVPEVPSLAEIVTEYGKKMHLFIELKAPFTAESSLQQTLQWLTPCEDYHLISLSEPILASLKTFPRKALLVTAAATNTSRFCRHSLEKHYGGVLGHHLLLTNNKIKQLKHANQAVGVGFVDSKFSLYRELNRGITWLFSNNVAEISTYLKELWNTK